MDLEVKKMLEKEHTQMMQFGWFVKDAMTERTYHGHSRFVFLMARDKDREHYKELKELEQKYRSYKNSLQEYKPMDEGVTILLYFLFILPGVIYTVYKAKQKEEITAHNNEMIARMNKVSEEAKKYL